MAEQHNAPDRGTPKYEAAREYLADLRARWGPDRFALRRGLRAPANERERLEAAYFQQQITKDEYADRLKAYVERPIDAEMLAAYCDAYEARLESYSNVLQAVIAIASDHTRDDDWDDDREAEVDRHVAAMDAKLGLFTDELTTVDQFLTGMRAERGEPIRCGKLTADNAHFLAAIVLRQVCEAWRSAKAIAQHSQSDPRYLYPTSAVTLFFEQWIAPASVPNPNDLAALLRLERAAAEKALRQLKPPAVAEAQLQQSRMTWQDAKTKAEQHVKRNGWPGLRALATIIGCSPATISKVVKNSPYLKARKAEHAPAGQPREVPLTDTAADEQAELVALIAEQQAEMKREERQAEAAKRGRSR